MMNLITQKKAISIGIEDYLLKPFTPEELLESMNKAAKQIAVEKKTAFRYFTLKG